jgi:Zn-dependent peptidase ImmA (M78 family)
MTTPAEKYLQSMGITEPREIDVVEIAKEMGADVEFKKPPNCEASIVGFRDRAVISVDPDTHESRQRFSIGHECGHWQHHRGRQFRCREEDIGNPRSKITDPERVADDYAADLLMPKYLFGPRSGAFRHTGFEAVGGLKDEFQTSLLATAIRLVEHGPEPAILVCHGVSGRKWFREGPRVNKRWFPQKILDDESYAYDILHGDERYARRRSRMQGDTWFDFDGSNDYEVFEESISYNNDVLTFITFADPDAAE